MITTIDLEEIFEVIKDAALKNALHVKIIETDYGNTYNFSISEYSLKVYEQLARESSPSASNEIDYEK